MKIFYVILLVTHFVVVSATSKLPNINQSFQFKKLLRSGIQTSPNPNCTILEQEYKISWQDIRLPHAYDCTKFYECDGPKLITKQCPDIFNTRYDPFHKVCEFNRITECINYGFYSELFNGHGVVTPEAGNTLSLCRKSTVTEVWWIFLWHFLLTDFN